MAGLNNLKPKPGSVRRPKRLGTGSGSGHGQTSTKGQKGQSATAGGAKRSGFEGGQIPLSRRVPKSGFTNNRFRVTFNWVNVSSLDKKFSNGEEVNPGNLADQRLVARNGLVKVLGDGELTKSLKVSAHSFSKSAKEKIEKAGGSVTVIARTGK
jgi:large subunit ribosomal protein L15